VTLIVTHSFVSTKPVGNDSSRIYSDSWNSNHTLTGTASATQLNGNVVQAVVNDTNVTGSILDQTLTLSWQGTLAAARLNANVVQAIINDTNVRGSIAAQNLTFSWSGQLGLSRGGTNADLSATGGAGQYLKQVSSGASVTVGTIPASDIASGTALTKTDDTNVTLTLGGTPTTALLKATSLTLGWTGTLSIARGGTGAGTQQAAFDALAPTATRAGDLTYWNGTHYVNLAGNNSGTKVLQEDSSGVPSWVTAGTGTVTTTGSPSANQVATFNSSTVIQGVNQASLLTAGSGIAITGTTNATIALASQAAFAVRLSANQTGVVSATPTKILFDTETYDVGSFFDAATNHRWTPPAGTVALSASMYGTGTIASGSSTALFLYKNGAQAFQINAFGATGAGFANGTFFDRANGTDYYEVFAYITTTSGTVTLSAATAPLLNFFQGFWICP
jgi:hypothetical protein